MTYLTGKTIVLTHNMHRLHAPIATLLVIAESIARAFAQETGIALIREPGTAMAATCNQFSVQVRLPMVGPVQYAAAGHLPSEVEVIFEPTGRPALGRAYDTNFTTFMTLAISPLFVSFLATYEDWLAASGHSDPYQWPTPLNFGRVVRNSIAHRGLRFDNPKATPVSWYGLTYGPAQNRHKVVGVDLAFADMLVLMFEMSDALDKLSAPLTPL